VEIPVLRVPVSNHKISAFLFITVATPVKIAAVCDIPASTSA